MPIFQITYGSTNWKEKQTSKEDEVSHPQPLVKQLVYLPCIFCSGQATTGRLHGLSVLVNPCPNLNSCLWTK